MKPHRHFVILRLVAACLAMGTCGISSAETTVLCLGDSITAGTYVVKAQTWAPILNTKLNASGTGTYVFTNKGENGMRADRLLSKLLAGNDIWTNPDIVTLMVGTNDINVAVDKAAAVPETFNEIQSCVNAILDYDYGDNTPPSIYVSAIIPSKTASLNVYFAQLNQMLASSLTGETVFFSENWTDLYDVSTGTANPSLMYDTLHPDADGHLLMADNFYSAMVPEPGAMTLLAVGGGMALLRRHRRRSANS